MATPSWRSSPVFRLSSKPANRTVVSAPGCESTEKPSTSKRQRLHYIPWQRRLRLMLSVSSVYRQIRSQSQLKQTASIDQIAASESGSQFAAGFFGEGMPNVAQSDFTRSDND